MKCASAKTGFEKNKVSQGFEALARAQYLLRSNKCLAKLNLLSEVKLVSFMCFTFGQISYSKAFSRHFLVFIYLS